MSWDNEKSLQLIKAYQDRPILWQKCHKLYYNNLKKEDAWKELSEMLSEDPEILKKKIDSLRGSRRREKTRMSKSVGTGKGRQDIYVSKWFAWDAMKFLDDPEEVRKTISSCSEENNEVLPGIISTNEDANPQPNQESQEKDNDIKDAENAKKFLTPKKQAPKRRRTEDPRIEEAFAILKENVNNDKRRDICSIFGEYVAAEIRKHDDRTRAILQQKINTILFEAAMSTQPVPASPSPSRSQTDFCSSPFMPSSPSSFTSFTSPLQSPNNFNSE